LTRRVFWHNVAANLIASMIALGFAVATYWWWKGRLPSLEELVD